MVENRTVIELRSVKLPKLRRSRSAPAVRSSTIHPQKIAVPSKPIVMEGLKTSQCALYARTLAERLFGLRYAKGHAWEYPLSNRAVWWRQNPTDTTFYNRLKPGQIVGLFYPKSTENQPGRAFTHVALVVGRRNGRPMIVHQFGTEFRLDDLSDFLVQEKSSVIALFEPAKLGQRIRNVARRAKSAIGKRVRKK
jgi:hypothetical protein